MSEKNVAIFVLTAAQLGIDFVDRFPRAREIVSSQLSSEDKATELEVFTRTLFETLALP